MLNGIVGLWWRSVRDEHRYSGIRLWVDAWRDMKAAKLRKARRFRDAQNEQRKAGRGRGRDGTLFYQPISAAQKRVLQMAASSNHLGQMQQALQYQNALMQQTSPYQSALGQIQQAALHNAALCQNGLRQYDDFFSRRAC